MFDKIGTRYPSYLPTLSNSDILDGYYNESTGMEYITYSRDSRIFVESWHEDVGLVTWYEWHGSLDELETELLTPSDF